MFDAVLESLPALGRGAVLTVSLVAASGAYGTVIGIIFAVASTAPSKTVRFVASIYPTFVRGIPPLVILLFVYFALPIAIPSLSFTQFSVAVMGLSVYGGAHFTEVFRGGITAIPKGQSEAASALGMGYLHRLFNVILPQSLKISVPSWITFLIALVFASAFVSVLGYIDLTYAAKISSTRSLQPVGIFAAAAAIYFVICYPLALVGRAVEMRLK